IRKKPERFSGPYQYIGAGAIEAIHNETDSGQSFALIRDYVQFPHPLPPRKKDGSAYETPYHGLRRLRDHHAEQTSVRNLSEEDYEGIVCDGFAGQSGAALPRAGFAEPMQS